MEALSVIVDKIGARMPEAIASMAGQFRAQHDRVQGNIVRFGRHPHRNTVLGRVSTPDEEAYIAEGDFPHLRKKPE